jgi:NAD(P)-dependent dehydrogenase (short-subunit alcohol dehydrogenase family)
MIEHDRAYGSANYPDLKGRVVAITGAGRGLGLAMAKGFARNGAHVLIGSLSLSESERAADLILKAGGSALPYGLDVVDREQCSRFVAQAVAHFGALDVIMCNAGISIHADAFATTEQAWQHTLDVDLTGAFNAALCAARHMKESRRGGAIVFTSSTAAQVGFERLAAYGAAKSAINQLVRTLALEWGAHGIRVNGIAPGWTNHRMEGSEAVVDRHAIERGIERTPLGRVGEPSEIAAPAIFLASQAASFITGTILTVDGGYTAT